MSESSPNAHPEEPQSRRRFGVALLLAALIAVLWIAFRDVLTLENFARHERQLRTLQANHPIFVYGVAFAVYVAVTGVSLPGATVLSLTYAWFFGFVPGVILISFASTAGATLAFLLSRYLFRDSIQRRFGERLHDFNAALERDGAFFLFSLRLIPAVPFFVINAVMGLTSIRTATFWWVSQLGMIPGTLVYVYAGSRVPRLQTLAELGLAAVFTKQQLTQITIALVLLGLFPLVARIVMNLRRK